MKFRKSSQELKFNKENLPQKIIQTAHHADESKIYNPANLYHRKIEKTPSHYNDRTVIERI